MKTINQLHKDDKPREKLVAKGVEALKNEELMALLLGRGVQGKDVRKLSKEIVSMLDKEFDHFGKLSDRMTLDALCDIHGH